MFLLRPAEGRCEGLISAHVESCPVRVFGVAPEQSATPTPLAGIFEKGARAAIGVASRLNHGRSISLEPLVRLLSMRVLARRYYGALIDATGATYADVDETMARIRSFRPEAWAREWRRTADRFAQLGREAAEHGHGASAVELLTKASKYYRFAEWSILVDSAEREALQTASVQAYGLAGKHMTPPLTSISLAIDGLAVPAYLRVPEASSPPAVVLIVPGLGMVKEHGDFPDEVILRRGMAAMSVDLPGQGESRPLLALNEENAQKVVGAAIDFLSECPSVDGRRIGVIGTSMGAAAAMLTAATDRRIKTLVEISGFYEPAAWWHEFPQAIKDFLRYVIGASSEEEMFEIVRSVNLRDRVEGIECPLLVVHGRRDQIVPFGESDLIWNAAKAPKERFIFETGDHGCVNVSEARPLVGDWIEERLRAA